MRLSNRSSGWQCARKAKTWRHAVLISSVPRLLEAALAAIGHGGARDGNSRRALERFCLELKKASVLHEHAGAFYGGWMRILANGLEAGYSPQGAGAWRFEAGRRVSLEA